MRSEVNKMEKAEKYCPKCKHTYKGHPAISRVDNKTEICPDCGLNEAIMAMIKATEKG